MSVYPTPKNFAVDVLRRLSKQQPHASKINRDGFPPGAEAIVVSRSGGICELDSCGVADVLHHRRPRGAGGTSLAWVNQAANAMHLSNECHLRVEGRLPDSSRHVSKVRGWLVSQNGTRTAVDVRVLYRGRWALLTDDGQVNPVKGGPA
ncbi:hypothetical protein [Nocardia sp. NBC_01388]|uniref:hypothetical protein n=1 Tax=Nocardia sp. NBC_01388 TaxID=2903596 RepID=UPI0032469600